jgi:hypothetical protein
LFFHSSQIWYNKYIYELLKHHFMISKFLEKGSLLKWPPKEAGKMSYILHLWLLRVSYILNFEQLELLMVPFPDLLRIAYQVLVYWVHLDYVGDKSVNWAVCWMNFNEMCRRLWSFSLPLSAGLWDPPWPRRNGCSTIHWFDWPSWDWSPIN